MRLKQNPNDAKVKAEYQQFVKEQNEAELAEFTLFANNYPTDMTYRFEAAKRLFNLQRYSEAIPVFQHARNDPKHHVDASVLLGQAFLGAGFCDEAVDTLRTTIEEYEVKGDQRSKELHYWYGRALEVKGDGPAALKCYSQVAVWDFNYRDVQARIKSLRGQTSAAAHPGR
jgi:tetratricopeptide (TPR) repeat protein